MKELFAGTRFADPNYDLTKDPNRSGESGVVHGGAKWIVDTLVSFAAPFAFNFFRQPIKDYAGVTNEQLDTFFGLSGK